MSEFRNGAFRNLFNFFLPRDVNSERNGLSARSRNLLSRSFGGRQIHVNYNNVSTRASESRRNCFSDPSP
jgi:hypothetical protein